MPQRKIETDNSVRFVDFAIVSQNEQDFSNEFLNKSRQNERSINKNNRKFTTKVTDEGARVIK